MRTKGEQKRGVYRVAGKDQAGVVILKRVRKRLLTVEWNAYLADDRLRVVSTALDVVAECMMKLACPLRA